MLSVVVDVGGTNIRFALVEATGATLSSIKEYKCTEFESLDVAIDTYFSTLSESVSALCIAIASFVDDDLVKMMNHSWQFSQQSLKEKLGIKSFYVINDYTAISLAVPFIEDRYLIKLGRGEIVENGCKAVFGAGTGLGVSHLIKQDTKWVSLEGEGGHTSFAPNTQHQAEVLLYLQALFGHVSNERLLSGQGLVNIYQALVHISGEEKNQLIDPAEISSAAINGKSALAYQALTLFCEVMGGFAGNLAMNLDCKGGVYIAGGLAPRFVDFIQTSQFRHFFEEKGRLKPYLINIPTYLITYNNPGLLGAAVYLQQELV